MQAGFSRGGVLSDDQVLWSSCLILNLPLTHVCVYFVCWGSYCSELLLPILLLGQTTLFQLLMWWHSLYLCCNFDIMTWVRNVLNLWLKWEFILDFNAVVPCLLVHCFSSKAWNKNSLVGRCVMLVPYLGLFPNSQIDINIFFIISIWSIRSYVQVVRYRLGV